MLLDAKLTTRQTVVDHFVEEGTQGLHYCRLELRSDEAPVNDEAAVELEDLHQRTRALADRIITPVRVGYCAYRDRY